jgi:hypothetical protein
MTNVTFIQRTGVISPTPAPPYPEAAHAVLERYREDFGLGAEAEAEAKKPFPWWALLGLATVGLAVAYLVVKERD